MDRQSLQTFNDILLSDTIKEAGAAKTSAEIAASSARKANAEAGSAKRKADDVAKQADALTIRLKSASGKLGDIEKDTLALRPRWRLLKRGEPEFVKALKPFAGQQVTVVICGQDDGERFQLEQLLLNLFPKAGDGISRDTGDGLNARSLLRVAMRYFSSHPHPVQTGAGQNHIHASESLIVSA